MKLSIIIVNYNTYGLTKQTIESVVDKAYSFTYEIVLVDNASMDGSIEALEKTFGEALDKGILHIIKPSANLGFAKTNNIGTKASKGEYILLFKSDANNSRWLRTLYGANGSRSKHRCFRL